MAFNIQVQSFLNSATKLTISVNTTTTVSQLKTAIWVAEGTTSTIMQLYYNNVELANTATMAPYSAGTYITSSNNISNHTLWTKQQRQILKLELAKLRRKAAGVTTADFYRDRNDYDITELPTTYVGNTATNDNPNVGGLVYGRPWI